MFAPAVDDFYNATGKASHPNAIVPKQESDWWAAHEEWKRRKAQERELAALQLREVQEQATRLAEQNATLEKELRDAHRSLSGASPTATPSTSATSVEDPVVVVPTPTGPSARPLSSRLVACVISLRASGSDFGGREVYPRLEDTPPLSRLHCQFLKDSLQFHVEEDLKSGNPSQGVYGLPFYDSGLRLSMEVLGRDDCEGGVGEGREEEALDYGSTPEWEAPEGGPVRPQLRSEVHVVQHDNTCNDEVFFLILHLLWFLFVFADFFARPCLFTSFVASDTNDVD